MATRTYTSREYTPAKTTEDLRLLSEEVVRILKEAEPAIALLRDCVPLLQLLQRRDEALDALPVKLENVDDGLRHIVEACAHANDQATQIKLFLQSTEMQTIREAYLNIVYLQNSLPDLLLLQKNVEALKLLQNSVPALGEVNRIIDNRCKQGLFQTWWNRLLRALSFNGLP